MNDLATPRGNAVEDRVIRFVQPSGGRGLRTLSGRKAIGSACLPLLKAGGAFEVESGPELRFAMNAEFETDIVRIRSQPVRVEGVQDGRTFTYIADAAALRADGSREIIEIKGSRSQLADERRRRRLELIASTVAAHGWNFRIHFDDEAAHPPLFRRNVETMFPRRLTVVTERHKAAAGRLLLSAGTTTLGALSAALDPTPSRALSIAYSMMARRLIQIDLTTRLGPRSLVRSVPALAAALPPLRF